MLYQHGVRSLDIRIIVLFFRTLLPFLVEFGELLQRFVLETDPY